MCRNTTGREFVFIFCLPVRIEIIRKIRLSKQQIREKLEKSHGNGKMLKSKSKYFKVIMAIRSTTRSVLRKRSFQRRTNATAYELFTNIKSDIRNLHTFELLLYSM